ncbi:PREDICTED: RINT1-like protein MAG2 isoform X1 [Camelina sativa]|uniref:RINT1-like protein MAG2 isoform X1 n=1 Tax=Camelina sativa TaxID=90675 RepID=A0ABM0YMV0_CAMSA|nr:PREDICTED: RINT1-like protein MAG2 isoform X1 [Camelina sativa]
MDAIKPLPQVSSFSASVFSFLDDRFRDAGDLSHSPGLVSELRTEISELDQRLAGLNRQLESGLASYASFSDRVGGLFVEVNAKLAHLSSSSTCVPRSPSDGGNEEEETTTEHVAGEELPSLAKEVAQVESVRAYVETALKLDTLVGDIEDAVMSSMNKNLRTSRSSGFEEVRLHAIKTLKTTEEILSSVARRHPRWARLVSAVDHRVDRALAMMRPQAISDYRALLSSLGWPPQISTLTSASKSEDVHNPLFTMEGSLKSQYCGNFHALCSLQGLQLQRKSRQLGSHKGENVLFHQPLWAIEELVNPLTVASQRHFTKWSEKPEFIFELVFKITKDYVDSMDELLQPLVDEAKLAGYSCREEWVSAMVSSLSLYLVKEIFPIYVGQLSEATESDLRSEAKVSWLHLIDLMISFDKRVQSLVSQSGILSLQEDGNLLRISSLSVFCDRPDWLDLWAEIELDERLVKFKAEIDYDRNWTVKVQDELISTSNVYRPPIISSIFLQHLSSIIERSKSVPAIYLRARFLRLAAAPTIQKFLDCVLLRCQEAEGLTALTENNDLVKVSNSINAGHYIESVLEEWSEDVFFLEMGTGQHDPQEIPGLENFTEPSEGIFGDEFEKLEKFRLEWINKLSVVVLRGFDARTRDYIKNRKQWQEKKDKEWTVSRTLVGALDYLQGKTSIIEENLNKEDFTAMWRSLASEIDRLFFNSILMANVKFSNDGVERFKGDMEVLYGVFRAWCVRPEGFFPKLSEGLTVLKMEEKQVKDGLSRGAKWLRENGVRYLSEAEAKKVAKSRVFS